MVQCLVRLFMGLRPSGSGSLVSDFRVEAQVPYMDPPEFNPSPLLRQVVP